MPRCRRVDQRIQDAVNRTGISQAWALITGSDHAQRMYQGLGLVFQRTIVFADPGLTAASGPVAEAWLQKVYEPQAVPSASSV